MTVKRIALTPGEPAGIGPDICLQIAQEAWPSEIVLIACPDLLIARAQQLQLNIDLYEWDPLQPPMPNGKGRIALSPVPLKAPCVPGTLDKRNAAYVLETLMRAVALCQQKDCHALVTGPVHKAIIHESGTPFSGHTGFLAEAAGIESNKVLMTFYTPHLLLALITAHYPLQAVSSLLTTERLIYAITLLDQQLKTRFHRSHPKIGICGLNPHAGENGTLGKEEQMIITPVIQALQQKGLHLHGPLPADTAFTPTYRQSLDALVAMYHDQGLAPFKALFFGEIVNVTLGLPFLRTSVDHGTALTLAGTSQASSMSLQKAIQLAITL